VLPIESLNQLYKVKKIDKVDTKTTIISRQYYKFKYNYHGLVSWLSLFIKCFYEHYFSSFSEMSSIIDSFVTQFNGVLFLIVNF